MELSHLKVGHTVKVYVKTKKGVFSYTGELLNVNEGFMELKDYKDLKIRAFNMMDVNMIEELDI